MSWGPIGMFGMATGNPILALVDQAIQANSKAYADMVPGRPMAWLHEHGTKDKTKSEPFSFQLSKEELLMIISAANERGLKDIEIEDFTIEQVDGGYQIVFLKK